MQLCKLTGDNVKLLEDKKIYCYEYSLAYMEELEDQFALSSSIAAVVDDNVRNQGEFEFKGKKIIVQGSESLGQTDWNNSVILIMSDYHLEAYDKLCAIRKIREGIDTIYYFENRVTAIEMEYRHRYQNEPLSDMILFRSGPHGGSYIEGDDFSDNARALFEYMLANGYNESWQLVWLVKNPELFADRCEKNVRFLSFDWAVSEIEEEREQYYHALCLAKFIFTTDGYGFARNRRASQKLIQLWHGCGFKTRVNFVRCEKRYDYMTVNSELYAEIHEKIYGLREDQLLTTGCAKQDWLLGTLEGADVDWLEIPGDHKCVFWLPTFRTSKGTFSYLTEQREASDTGLPVADSFEKLETLNDLLKREKIKLFVKLHPLQDKDAIQCGKLSHIILLDNHELFVRDIQINQLLPIADALISDYSSAAVDYLLLDRPIAFTLDDVEEYASSRGFVFDPIRDWLPGEEIYTFEQFCYFLEKIAAGEDSTRDKRRMLTDKMHKYRDGNNCKRICEALGL